MTGKDDGKLLLCKEVASKGKTSTTTRAENQCYCHKEFSTQQHLSDHMEQHHKQDNGTELWVCDFEPCKSESRLVSALWKGLDDTAI